MGVSGRAGGTTWLWASINRETSHFGPAVKAEMMFSGFTSFIFSFRPADEGYAFSHCPINSNLVQVKQ